MFSKIKEKNNQRDSRKNRSRPRRRKKFKKAKQGRKPAKSKRRGSYRRRYSAVFSLLNFLKNRLGTILGLLAIVGLVVVLRLIFSTDYFDVKEIRVIGLEKTDRTALEQIAKEYKGKNIYSVNLDELEKEVENISIYIKNVYAKKHLPDRIEINIKERYPSYAVLNYDGIYLIDEEFVVTNIPVKQEIGFSKEEMDAYAKNDINSEVIKERLFSKIKSEEIEDLELKDILKEDVKLEEVETIEIENVDSAKIPEELKLEELGKLKKEIDAIIYEHFDSLEQIANESEFAGLRRVYFRKNGIYEEGSTAEEDRLKLYDVVYEYFAEDDKYSILKATWTSDYTLQIDFLEEKTILFANNRDVDSQLEDLEIVLEELRTAGKDFSRIDLRTETIGVK